jgi:hypothetical protein
MKRKWLVLAGVVLAALGLVAFLVWSAAEDAREDAWQKSLLDARFRDAHDRVERVSGRVNRAAARYERARDRVNRLARDGAPADEVSQARADCDAAKQAADDAASSLYHAWQSYWFAYEELREEELRRARAQRPEPWHSRLRQEVRRRTGW